MLKQIVTLALYTLLEAWRTRFFVLVAVLLMAGNGLTLFVGNVAIIEKTAMQSNLLAAFSRLSSIYIVSLFVISSMVREFADQAIYIWLSAPMRRGTYLFGKLAGFSLIALITTTAFSLMLLNYASGIPVTLWAFSLFCELLIVVTISLLCVLTFNHTVQAFSAVLGFYLLSRSIDAVQLMTKGPLHSSDSSLFSQFVDSIIHLLSLLLPSLSQFTQSAWLIYPIDNPNQTLMLIIIQTIIYILLLIGMNLFDLYRKNL